MEEDKFTICLNQMKLRGHHGLYPEEKEKGNDFIVDFKYQIPFRSVSDISQTVDYAEVARRIKQEFQKPTELLETLVDQLLVSIFAHFPGISEATICVQKLSPPMEIELYSTEVCLSKKNSK